MTVSIGYMSKLFVEEHLSDIVRLDSPHISNRSLEYWSEKNYLSDLPGKWVLSSFAMEDGLLLGYRIVSFNGKIDGFAHTHRTSILQERLRMGVARVLLEASIEVAKKMQFRGVTGLRFVNNERSLKFLQSTGWKFSGEYINDNELWVLEF